MEHGVTGTAGPDRSLIKNTRAGAHSNADVKITGTDYVIEIYGTSVYLRENKSGPPCFVNESPDRWTALNFANAIANGFLDKVAAFLESLAEKQEKGAEILEKAKEETT